MKLLDLVILTIESRVINFTRLIALCNVFLERGRVVAAAKEV